MIRKILIALLLITTFTLSAQRTNSSPYSFFGIGDEFNATTVEQSAMGGIGVAYSHYKYLNFTNPAANADLRVATYALGGSLSFLTLKEENSSQSGNSTNLRYISFGFPIGKKAGLSVGLQPFSSVGYSSYDNQSDTEATLYRGEGGTNKIYIGFGTSVFKGLSLGLEAGYIFGSLENSILNERTNVSLVTKYEENVNIRGGQFKLGAKFEKELKNKLNLYSGASITLNSNLSAKGNEKMYSRPLRAKVLNDSYRIDRFVPRTIWLKNKRQILDLFLSFEESKDALDPYEK